MKLYGKLYEIGMKLYGNRYVIWKRIGFEMLVFVISML